MIANALFSCLVFNLPAAAADELGRRKVQWEVLNTRSGRALVDMIGDKDDLQWIAQRLNAAGMDPKLIMAWRADTGERVKNVSWNLAAYLAVAPDQMDYTDPHNPVSSRPTTYIQTHAWAGWASQSNNVES